MARERVALFEFLPQPGGGQRVCALMAQTLSRHYRVDLLTPEPSSRSWWEGHFGVSLEGVRIETANLRGRGRTRVYTLPDRYDIFVNAEYAYWTVNPLDAGIRLIVAHDAYPVGREPSFLEDYHRAIACSAYSQSKLEDEGWPIPKRILYPPIFDSDALAPGGPAPRSRGNRILTVARIDRNRNDNSLPTVIEAFAAACDQGLRGYELTIAGWVQDRPLLDHLVAAARGYPIRFVASPTADELRQLYRTAKFLLNVRGIDMPLPTTPFSHEALGVVTVEAICHGCLPIVHGFAGHRETVPAPDLHIHDLTSMPERLIEILQQHEDPTVWTATWGRLYEMAKQRFSPESYLRNFRNLVDEVRQS